MNDTENRNKLLLKMYDQLFNDINRHITVVWQSVGVLIGAFAIFALTEKQIVSIDVATSLIIIIAGWLLAHLFDAGYWYNRNLVIIANIEKQFLLQNDLKNIHYYFGKHRKRNKMIKHLRIQFWLGIGVMIVVLSSHFIDRIVTGFSQPLSNFELKRSLPYLCLTVVIILLVRFKIGRNKRYNKFLQNSPGKIIDTNSIDYTLGHGA